MQFRLLGCIWSLAAFAQQPAPPPDDPFADVTVRAPEPAPSPRHGWLQSLYRDNFGFRKEVMSQFTFTPDGNPASRQSAGFELLKKFSTETSTFASFNMQGRLVRRDRYNPVQNDVEGQHRPGWTFEYHNLYADFYNVLNPVLGSAKGRNAGRFNVRAGRFYVPFGLNLQTDTHGTVMQLSNDQNFGFERDWYTGLWGSINRWLNYDAYYLTGSGYDLTYQGQKGLGALRLSLGNAALSRYGLEAGVAVLRGDRLSMDPHHRRPIDTQRTGADIRYRRPIPTGTFTSTMELSTGRDNRSNINQGLWQGDYLHASRRWGLASQYRRLGLQQAVSAEFTYYLRNDVANSSLHWIKFHTQHSWGLPERSRTVFTVQYYFYR